jgi:hypothetical protein
MVCSPGENGHLAEDELEPLVMAEYVSLEEPENLLITILS